MFQYVIATPSLVDLGMRDILSNLGLATNLKLCLDAGDINSVASASQTKWLDVSGGGYDFFRGTDATSQSTDPTFNGTPGGLQATEYWGLDGGDYFTYDTTNETWMDALHKNNALFSIAIWAYLPSPFPSNRGLLGTSGDITVGTGMALSWGAVFPAVVSMDVRNAGSSALSIALAGNLNTSGSGGWNFISISVDEAAGTYVSNVNGTAGSGTGTYVSPAAGAASRTMQIGAQGNADRTAITGTRVSKVAVWQGTALTAANLATIFSTTKYMFGL